MPNSLHVVAGCLLDGQRRLLLVRKQGCALFMLPGGKPEAGERPMETLSRECREELGVSLEEEALSMLGRFRSTAANEPDTPLDADVFVIEALDGVPAAANEIAELRWFALEDDDSVLAPLLRDEVLPALRQRFGIDHGR
ncbi:NUDIX hydrolase [Kushneria aurantia]|uniref:NUDIX domain-containing protein n=1 Tax=Kushneria aurantia TaxID=504092 RepID=A0ABV6G8L1_9GAMM|nr:NUDIX domain-containing protein [Kushneria aurantia]